MQTKQLIHIDGISRATARIAKLAKRAAKLNVPAPSIEFGDTVMVEDTDQYGNLCFTKKIEVTVTGQAPKLNGWWFVAAIDNVNNSAVIRTVPGIEIPEQYMHTNPCQCDHCNVQRYRTSTFVVFNGTEHRQVGKSCLKDFLGHQSPEAAVQYTSLLCDMSQDLEENDRGSARTYQYNTELVAAIAAASVKERGYVRTDSELCSTRDVIEGYFMSKNSDSKFKISDEDFELAKQAIAWMKTLDSSNTFNHNLCVYANQPAVGFKSFGFLAAGVYSFLKTLETKKVRTSLADGVCNEPIAEPGTKVSVLCTVVTASTYNRAKYHYFDSGLSQVLVMRTADNKLIKMFSSNMEIAAGATVTVSGKIENCERETFEKSPFKGCLMTSMAYRTRITLRTAAA